MNRLLAASITLMNVKLTFTTRKRKPIYEELAGKQLTWTSLHHISDLPFIFRYNTYQKTDFTLRSGGSGNAVTVKNALTGLALPRCPGLIMPVK